MGQRDTIDTADENQGYTGVHEVGVESKVVNFSNEAEADQKMYDSMTASGQGQNQRMEQVTNERLLGDDAFIPFSEYIQVSSSSSNSEGERVDLNGKRKKDKRKKVKKKNLSLQF